MLWSRDRKTDPGAINYASITGKNGNWRKSFLMNIIVMKTNAG
jgi:hypothetical protein